MTDPTSLVERYIDLFNQTDPDRRRQGVADLFADQARYVDPNVDLAGHDQLEAFIAATQETFPGYRFTLGSRPDRHHDQVRFTWHATAPDANEPAYIGFDVIVHSHDRIDHVLGFVDRAPSY